MKIPRIILNPSVAGWIRLLQRERKENARLRRELTEWQNKFLSKVNVTPLFVPPFKVEPQKPLIIGPLGKAQHLASHPKDNHVPTAEEVLLGK